MTIPSRMGFEVLVSPDPTTLPRPGQPFDALKRSDAERVEYWSARDLMPHLEYDRWENFEAAIARAQAACQNAGQQVPANFRRKLSVSSQVPGATKQVASVPRVDYEVSRFGAYLIAMNGDPRKDAIARAQAYFATATRWAEVQRVNPGQQLTRKEILTMALEAEERAAEAEQRAEGWALTAAKRSQELAEVKPTVDAFNTYLNADGTKPVGVVAQEMGIGQTRLFEFLREQRVLLSTPGSRFNTPYQAHIETGRFRIKAGTRDSTSEGTKPTFTTVVTPKGEAFIYRLIKEHGTEAMIRALNRVAVTPGTRVEVTGQ